MKQFKDLTVEDRLWKLSLSIINDISRNTNNLDDNITTLSIKSIAGYGDDAISIQLYDNRFTPYLHQTHVIHKNKIYAPSKKGVIEGFRKYIANRLNLKEKELKELDTEIKDIRFRFYDLLK